MQVHVDKCHCPEMDNATYHTNHVAQQNAAVRASRHSTEGEGTCLSASAARCMLHAAPRGCSGHRVKPCSQRIPRACVIRVFASPQALEIAQRLGVGAVPFYAASAAEFAAHTEGWCAADTPAGAEAAFRRGEERECDCTHFCWSPPLLSAFYRGFAEQLRAARARIGDARWRRPERLYAPPPPPPGGIRPRRPGAPLRDPSADHGADESLTPILRGMWRDDAWRSPGAAQLLLATPPPAGPPTLYLTVCGTRPVWIYDMEPSV